MSDDRRPSRRANLVSREQARRRVILLGIGMLILLVLSPLFSHHVVRGTELFLASTDHIGALCIVALHALLEPVHSVFHLIFLAGLAYAVADRTNAWWQGRAVLRCLTAEAPRKGDPFWRAASAAGVESGIVRVVPGLPTPAFTVGWVRPRIYVAEALDEILQFDELVAVIAHEGAHAYRRDPLRLSLLRFLTCTLFWIPALRRLAEDVADEAEILADDVAAVGNPLVLASAIVTLAKAAPGTGFPRAFVGFHRSGLLERRVRRLLGEDPVPGSHLTRRSLVGASVALVLMFMSGAVMAHPVAGPDPDAHPAHCQHDGPAVTHLFCLTQGLTIGTHDCKRAHD